MVWRWRATLGGLALQLVSSTLAIRKSTGALRLFLAGLGVVDGLGVTAAAWLDFWHRGSVSLIQTISPALPLPLERPLAECANALS
jgi:hypothetical protein